VVGRGSGGGAGMGWGGLDIGFMGGRVELGVWKCFEKSLEKTLWL
jgi:hypothetical protein